MNLTEAEDIEKRWQEYTELYKIDLHDPDNHDGVITHLQVTPECEAKRALGSMTMNKASGDDGIPVELFHILKAKHDSLLLPLKSSNYLPSPTVIEGEENLYKTVQKNYKKRSS